MILHITRVTLSQDNTLATVHWVNTRHQCGTTSGHKCNERIASLLLRAYREGVEVGTDRG